MTAQGSINTIVAISYQGGLIQKIVFSLLINVIWMLMEFLTGYIFVLCGVDYMVPQLLGTIISQFLTIILIFYLKRFFQNDNIKNLSIKYNVMLLLIPTGSMYIVYNIFMLSVNLQIDNHAKESLTSMVLILLMNIVIFKLYLSLSKEKELQCFNTVYEQQLNLCNQHMKEKESVMMELRNARHDIKQHFTVLMELLDQHENKTALQYLEKIIDMEPIDNISVCNTENLVIDSLINAKYAIAIKKQIDFTFDIHIPMQLPFSSADLCIILGNVLDNAIEASAKVKINARYINLYMRLDKNILIITVINPYIGKVNINKNGKLLTQKEIPIYHGIGLESVQKVVDKYHGGMFIKFSDQKFVIKITLCDLQK